jgi:hypothetical protein
MENEKYPIREDWEDYYKTLEAIRRTGAVNMWGADIYLKECYIDLSEKDAKGILCNWIHNYNELNKRFGWQETK